MCGIAGYIGRPKTNKVSDILTNLLVETQVRGHHATGFGALYEDGRQGFFKAPVPAVNFVRYSQYLSVIANKPIAFMGHTRYATSGDPQINTNNHPFVSEDKRFVFVHNGKVGTSTLDFNESYYVSSALKSQTDSEMLLRTIEMCVASGDTVVKAIKHSIRHFPNAEFACALLDNQKKELYVWRNYHRPLWVWDLVAEHGVAFVSSTKTIMMKALHKAGIYKEPVGFQIRPYQIYRFTHTCEYALYELDMHKLPFPITKPVKDKKASTKSKGKKNISGFYPTNEPNPFTDEFNAFLNQSFNDIFTGTDDGDIHIT